jgi:hypothetical protein
VKLAPGEADDLVAKHRQSSITGSIALERGSAPVCLPAVDFDDQTLSPPQEIDLEVVDGHVYCRLGKAVVAADGQHALLELTACTVRFGSLMDGQPQELRFSQRSRELGWGKEGTEVDDGPPGSGHRDAVSPGAVTGTDGAGAVEDDALTLPEAARSWHRDVDVCRFARLG